MTFAYKEGIVYKTLTIRRFKELITVLDHLTSTRREWICTTTDAGWAVEYESYDDDKLFSELREQ